MAAAAAGVGVASSQILSLYRRLLREGQKFNHYNYREFAVRRVRDYFKDKKTLATAQEIKKEYQYGLDSLGLIKRQVTIGELYSQNKLVIER